MNANAKKTMPFIPYGRQLVEMDDVEAVARVLQSDWLTTGPKVGEFEMAIADFVGASYGVAVSSGTAALHTAMHSIGVRKGDEVIVPAMTFAATAHAVVYQGGKPVFADVLPDTLLMDPAQAERLISQRTKAIVAVDYAGQPCDYDALRDLAGKHDLILVSDSCHALGAEYKGRPLATFADLTVFSFHPVKHITTGEGGMVVTNNELFASRMRRFRNHGIESDHFKRQQQGSWYYEMVDLGFNYRISDIQCALGLSQLRKLPVWLDRRQEIAQRYDDLLANVTTVRPVTNRSGDGHAYHLYPVQLSPAVSREKVFQEMRGAGVGVNVHYLPVHLHPFYKQRFATFPGLCPAAEEAYEHLLSLPLHQSMEDGDVQRVMAALNEALD